MTAPGGGPVLRVRKLGVSFGQTSLVDGLNFDVGRGEIVALVGESGSGKSVSSLAILGLLPGADISGSAVLHAPGPAGDRDGIELLGRPERLLRPLRGKRVSMIFQDPMSSLNPIRTIGAQLREILALHAGLDGRAAERRAVDLLAQVGIVDPQGCMRLIPQRLSGGMRQRVVIALAIAGGPDLLIADEPTTALDVTIQAQVLRLLLDLRADMGMAMVFITHNLAVASAIADRVVVLYAGQIVEDAPAAAFFAAPRMPYSRGLLAAAPGLDRIASGARRLGTLPGQVPPPDERGAGCRFAPRCAWMMPDPCARRMPALEHVAPAGPGGPPHLARCARLEEIGE
ncbi:ABC transporter ATP-binding protein [Gluconacetobacter tumulisoli]|uniref:ABC transporter ATP-binding protein n=1 Tax=Gluconacetobacter tumulisoli TaxID=1286189 RepID=A0A7W4K822_9PROT|nr:ABC transporter ATP-binding protein [Gluconacetobacter tumulisoli]MBB2202079.1 ABC transporter ATP-binding protein [Gluconacetobacter tumulisoli]